MTTVRIKRTELNRLADAPVSSVLRYHAFVEMSHVMQATLAELRILYAALQEEVHTTRARAVALQAEAARLRARPL